MALNPGDIVGKISAVENGNKVYDGRLVAFTPDGFLVTPTADAPGVQEIDVPGVVLRARTAHRTFEVVRPDLPIALGDIVRTAPDSVVTVDLFVGARVGVKRGSTVKIVSEGDCRVLDDGAWRTVNVKSGGIWAKFDKQERPVRIQTKGGVLGIKG
jgi:hypothetical protein